MSIRNVDTMSFRIILCVLVFTLHFGLGLVEVLSPPEIAGVYPDAPLEIRPLIFNVTGEVVLPKANLCSQESLQNENFTNKIVLILNVDEACEATTFAQRVLSNSPNALGQLIACGGRTCSVLGHLDTNVKTKAYDLVALPTSNFNDFGKIFAYLRKDVREPVIVHMVNTDYNPWTSLGNGPAGLFMTVFFELFAFLSLVVASFKLFVFIKFQFFRTNITQICLWIEITAALMRMVYMIAPLDFRALYPWSVELWFLDVPNTFSLLTTLLITFYWAEIVSVVPDQLSTRIINNISKFRIAFLITATLVLILQILSYANSLAYFMTFSSYTLNSTFDLVVAFCISVFFLGVGYRILKVSDKRRASRKATKVSKFILASAIAMLIRVFSLCLYLSPVASLGRDIYFFIWWLRFLSSYVISFAKILAFEPPPNASKSFVSYFEIPNKMMAKFWDRIVFTVTGDKSGNDKVSDITTNVEDTRNTRSMSLNSEDWNEEEMDQSSV